jgi:periplasmic divalent cation tolerance protein
MEEAIVVFITAQDMKQAENISYSLIETKLAACINIVPSVKSIFWWQGKIDSSNEVMIIVKTRDVLLKRLISEVKRLHTYDVPEIIALSIKGGNEEYLRWLHDSTS